MAIQYINTGSVANDGSGDNLRVGAQKINANFLEVDSKFNTTLVSGSSQISYTGITDKPTLVSGSSQIEFAEINNTPSVIVSGSDQVSGSFVNLDGDVMTGGITTPSISSSYMDLKVDGLPPYQEGRIFYDSATGAFSVYNDQPDITLQLGQEMYMKVINKSGLDILNGYPVYISGSQGDQAKIWLAVAHEVNDEDYHNHILGVATHDILNDESGYVTTLGLVNDLDTSKWIGGTPLYLSSSAGEYTNVPEVYPYEKVFVGYVARQHANVGSIYVKPSEPIHFADISGLAGDGSVENDLWVKDVDGAWRARNYDLELSGSFNVSATGSLILDPTVPTSVSGSGTKGEIRVDDSYIYVCTATDTWKRSPLAIW